ncbi:SDR family NAD(P)-dependent oxidoreductase [Paenibacillus qinlingensis]|uniref:SDR family NAD(P)-dependent oxidoreductase n=1 Tax=Paenibacillus qinlingensis TaxID=1837343 RepID=UPI0015645F81|nr:SDR family NAD(P)-dependent oxidoreductase [Paenibacillus qinlingensis]NQX57249.1 SDR family NAD(P)-dependent oxidoreductase [Paenibacillus qinlingensis]
MNKNLSGKIVLLTGASSGIGLALTHQLLQEGAQIIALIRTGYPKNDTAIQSAIGTRQLRVYQADLSDFTSLREALEQIKNNEQMIDLLFNNAGGSFPELVFSKQGRELHYELQTVVPYIITMELKTLLMKGSLKRVVHTSTNAFNTMKRFDPETLDHPAQFKMLFGPYAASKLALSLWTQELAPHLALEGITMITVDPGGNNTMRKGKQSGIPFYLKPIIHLFFPHPSKGASLLYQGALADHIPGAYLTKNKRAELKFVQHAPRVLEKVRAIYEYMYTEVGK